MAELGLEDRNQQISRFRARDFSPDSVIFIAESNFSLFSSASTSVNRCSFASDRDSLVSEVSQHLAGRDLRETSGGPDSDPNKSTGHSNSCYRRKVEKAKVQKEENDEEIENKNETLDSARNSFSQPLKECQERRSRSENILKKSDRGRPASLDLNNHTTNATNASPRFGVMKKGSGSTRQIGTFPSPGTPNYRHTSIGAQKGWSSERVSLHTNGNRKQVNAALLPFNNGRTLPSKWEDAERWIFSPVSGDGPVRPSLQQPQRRPKSKSGPLGPPGVAYYSLCSPILPMFEGGNLGNLMAGSPFSARVLGADGLSIRSGAGSGAGIYPAHLEPCMARSVSIHGCSELLSHSSLPGPQDGKIDENKDEATDISRDVSRRDMATQMSPEGSHQSSPRRKLSFSPSTSSVLSIVQLESVQPSKLEVRDVQVDERVTMTRWSKKHRVRFSGKGSENDDEWKKKDLEAESSSWEVSKAAKNISKMKREEAKVNAWENLQKAKAEAAIRKLKMKLEKKRSSSMDRIVKKLRSAQKKAQEMRNSVLTNQSRQVARTSNKLISFRRVPHISSLSGCFTCHAF
ncbi:Remorin, C-terminal protein isoform 1 [Actinidia chinensis var. chinensis]|uniref:Remorin, C-terminal protein isoform 1 n=1 Tax=Actinidia chinensis var. chinensis TaxID=1590841 RepID=A0A2R6QXY5_ACTCC|nr:Remorin, C-terminal protein isoform 1 [Actinidia chinensis var. chinensis]